MLVNASLVVRKYLMLSTLRIWDDDIGNEKDQQNSINLRKRKDISDLDKINEDADR